MTGPLHIGDHRLVAPSGPVGGAFVELDGEPHYRIENVDRMDPFFVSVVSGSDHWLFVSSRGGLTAGRRDADGALFPYTTDDRVDDSSGRRGGRTVLLVTRGERVSRWEPLHPEASGLYRITRSLAKNVAGTRLVFEERNQDLGLTFRATWTSGERFGFQRQVTLREDRGDPVTVRLLDGLLDVLPAGVEHGMQSSYSTLVDAYKRTELCPESGLAVYRLSSIPVDRAEPSEALQANTVWCSGLPSSKLLLSSAQLERFRRGEAVEAEREVRGVRGAFLVQAELTLAGGASQGWTIVAEVEQDSASVAALDRALREGRHGPADLSADAGANTRRLIELVGRADGLHCTGSPLEDTRHFANTLFNVMRGGVFEAGGALPGADLAEHVRELAPLVAAHHGGWLEALPERLSRADALESARATGDPDLIRVVGEYLPLLFSRRHGDPSRPWNAFSILTRGADGRSPYAYQGNWRDIFQNWEALCASFPAFLEATVTRFVNASTADGYNPYRVTRAGFEWEVPDPDDPWAFIGYWGDHQLIYLLRLLEAWQRHRPAELTAALHREEHVSADVPYRIAGHDDICADPRATITYDRAHAARIEGRVRVEGHEGRLVRDRHGDLHRVSLAEKLLVPVLVKLTNFVPEIGLWLTTQRPEWNDANNALVGTGASVVTLGHLRASLERYAALFEEAGGSFALSVEVAELFEAVRRAIAAAPPERALEPRERRALLDRLGRAGEAHRGRLYAGGFSGERAPVDAADLVAALRQARAWVDHALRANRRDDGLYHAYNLLVFDADGGVRARHLPPMLEGQVAVLSSGLLDRGESLQVLDALRASALYRADQESYLLYPDRDLPRFLEINRLPADAVERSALLRALVAAGERSVVVPGEDGSLHFARGLRNAALLDQALDALASGPHAELARAERDLVLDLYEEVFDHAAFTGRSGTFYGYEGLGCIYWHQVSKLLLAVRELCDQQQDPELEARYAELRRGLGTHRSPDSYGAFPTDPYSHTPSFAGAQQPGMTGQVKEDFLARMAELGVRVEDGCLHLGPVRAGLVHPVTGPTPFALPAEQGEPAEVQVPAGGFAYTWSRVPVVAALEGEPRVTVHLADGGQRSFEGLALDRRTSEAVFRRAGEVLRIEVRGARG